MKTPELLAPAGTLENMRTAFAFGADAVYAGQPRYSLRARSNEFGIEQLAEGIAEAHRQTKRFFVASNLMPHNAKVKSYLADMEPVIAMQPDALIMADPGLIAMVRERWPEMPIHLSVQANTVNYAAVKFWQQMGLSRVILSRELSLDEIAEIRQQCPDMELEVFIHGALCIAYSGRCLLSGYFNHRDPNQGTCTNSCRWDYKVHEVTDTVPARETLNKLIPFVVSLSNHERNQQFTVRPEPFGFAQESPVEGLNQSFPSFSDCGNLPRHPAADKEYLLEEGERPGELMPIMEDEHGTYIMNSKDLRAVQHVEKLVQIGIDSVKIEGRTKSVYYVARTTQTYRKAIDDAVSGNPFDLTLLADLESLASRGYTDGFYQRHHTAEHQNYLRGHSESSRRQYVGDVVGYDTVSGLAEIAVKNRFGVGDRLEIIHPAGNREVLVEVLLNNKGEQINEAPGSGYRVRLPLPGGNVEQALLARFLREASD